jgi:hypothetical protein
LSRLLHSKHPYSLVKTDKNDVHASEKADGAVQVMHSPSNTSTIRIDAEKSKSTPSASLSRPEYVPPALRVADKDIISTYNHQGYNSARNGPSMVPTPKYSGYFGEDNVSSADSDSADMDLLLSNHSGDEDDESSQISEEMAQIQHAPLLDANIISCGTQQLLPQYGLIASYDKAKNTQSKLLLNTNVPFSIFVCGVQGSGKSHTTSCILENSLMPSKQLGKLQNPLSALVLSYGQFNGDGTGFSISEATFLASPKPGWPYGARVKKVRVLVSPSNYVRISKLYLQFPNVSVMRFKIKPRNLDVNTILTLMNVSESDETPLYMAQVTQILREMSTAGGPFDYKAFKLHLKKQEFNSTQTNMLQMFLRHE